MLKAALSSVLSQNEISLLSSSFDVIGDIAIVKIPHELEAKQDLIAKEILLRMKNVKTVLKQSSNVEGEFRIRKLNFIAGEEKFETIYRESGCLFKVDVSSVYFSPRLSTERERIAALIHDGEVILNMFAGIGTFSIIAAKRKNCTVKSVDKNPAAISLAKESLKLNRNLKGVVDPILSDAHDYSKANPSTFDRVLMPLPEKSAEFIQDAFSSVKIGGVVHYYTHVREDDFLEKSWIQAHIAPLVIDRKFVIKTWKRVREVGPRYIQAVADIAVSG